MSDWVHQIEITVSGLMVKEGWVLFFVGFKLFEFSFEAVPDSAEKFQFKFAGVLPGNCELFLLMVYFFHKFFEFALKF